MGRYEPRLFDEILAWLEVNGHWLDAPRLRTILRKQDDSSARVVGGTLQYILSRGDKRKWQNLARFCGSLFKRQPDADPLEPLFKEKSGDSHPLALPANLDPSFAAFYINRPKIRIQKEGKAVSVNARANLRFLLRSLFGAGAKSEAILYLLTHEGGRPREIADDVGMFWLSVHQALLDLSRSGLVLTRSKGKKVEYWLSQPKWWDFLASANYESSKPPKWINWLAIYSALSTAWKTVDELALRPHSDYMTSSKLQDSLEIVGHEFARAGYDTSRMPRPGLPPDVHQKMALRFLGEIIGVESV
ncbi:MAG: hypothetical protein HY924_11060 [Elusimicrobia bacterium]|nr:hypothetical protein [Elusimicrobiota bacterium]